VKVGDLIQSSAFEGQNGIILEVDILSTWLFVHWLSVNKAYLRGPQEWLRPWEIEPRDIS